MRIVEISSTGDVEALEVHAQPVSLVGKIVVIFGGAGTLGSAFARAAAEAGATIAVADLPPSSPERKSAFEERFNTIGGTLAALADRTGSARPRLMHADVTNADDVREAVGATIERYGRVDIGVDFAGAHHPVFDLTVDDPAVLAERFRRVVELNLTGAFIFTAVLARVMSRQRSGHIIHLCSNGSRLSLYGSYAYNASKHGVEGIVKTAAAQLAPVGVRVNAIAPGTILTDLNRELSMTPEGEYRPRARSILAHTPTKRFATVDGVVQSLLSMCIPQKHFTGNVVFIDDGYNVEGHSWPEGNDALYAGAEALENLYRELDDRFPPSSGKSDV